MTYNNKSLDLYIDKIGNKNKIHKITSYQRMNNNISFFQRLFSSDLPGFASHDIDRIVRDIDKLVLKCGDFDIYYFATQLMGQAIIKKKWPGILILDIYDIYTTYNHGKILDIPIWKPFHWLFRLETMRIRFYEKKIFSLFNHIFVTCKEDMDTVGNLVSHSSKYILTNGINYPKKISYHPENETILMVGNFEHAPNQTGILWFYNEVWQILKKKSQNSQLCLVGKIPNNLKAIFSNDKDIEITGVVNNLDHYYEKANCVIIPIFHSSGIKTKLIEALAYGIPIISTPAGAIGFKNVKTITVAGTPKSFAKAILKLLKSNNFNEKEIDRARQLIKKKYTWDKIGDDLNNKIDSIIAMSDQESSIQ